MRKTTFIISILLLATTTFSQSASATYTAGDIPTTYITSASITTSSIATDPGTLTITLPTGNTTITSVDVAYPMTAHNGAYMAEQRSFLKCVSTNGSTEAEVYSGVGNAEGTYSYNRTNLSIANSVTGGGDIEFELHAFRTYIDDGSNIAHQYVNNNSWSVTVSYTYIPPPELPTNPTNFMQTTRGASQIALTWNKDANNNNVMLAINSTNSFGTPINGTVYSVGNSITGGGTIIYSGDSEFYNHVNLEAQATYYYKIWSLNEVNFYSSGVEGSATSVSNPVVSNVEFSETDGIVDVYYDVADGEADSVSIIMEVSDDGGATYNFPCTQITGDVGANISIGTNKHIVWNFGREHSGVEGDNFIIQILADDLYGDQIYYAGQIYNTITIGTQVWFKENLNVGTKINSTTLSPKDNGIIEKYCYVNNSANCYTYGGLYEWTEAMQYVTTEGTQGICPSGWHIPTLAEMQTLKTYVGNRAAKLVDASQTATAYTPTNETGFSALFAGHISSSNNYSKSSFKTYFWSSTFYFQYIYFMELNYGNPTINFNKFTAKSGLSLRCLKD